MGRKDPQTIHRNQPRRTPITGPRPHSRCRHAAGGAVPADGGNTGGNTGGTVGGHASTTGQPAARVAHRSTGHANAAPRHESAEGVAGNAYVKHRVHGHRLLIHCAASVMTSMTDGPNMTTATRTIRVVVVVHDLPTIARRRAATYSPGRITPRGGPYSEGSGRPRSWLDTSSKPKRHGGQQSGDPGAGSSPHALRRKPPLAGHPYPRPRGARRNRIVDVVVIVEPNAMRCSR